MQRRRHGPGEQERQGRDRGDRQRRPEGQGIQPEEELCVLHDHQMDQVGAEGVFRQPAYQRVRPEPRVAEEGEDRERLKQRAERELPVVVVAGLLRPERDGQIEQDRRQRAQDPEQVDRDPLPPAQLDPAQPIAEQEVAAVAEDHVHAHLAHVHHRRAEAPDQRLAAEVADHRLRLREDDGEQQGQDQEIPAPAGVRGDRPEKGEAHVQTCDHKEEPDVIGPEDQLGQQARGPRLERAHGGVEGGPEAEGRRHAEHIFGIDLPDGDLPSEEERPADHHKHRDAILREAAIDVEAAPGSPVHVDVIPVLGGRMPDEDRDQGNHPQIIKVVDPLRGGTSFVTHHPIHP